MKALYRTAGRTVTALAMAVCFVYVDMLPALPVLAGALNHG